MPLAWANSANVIQRAPSVSAAPWEVLSAVSVLMCRAYGAASSRSKPENTGPTGPRFRLGAPLLMPTSSPGGLEALPDQQRGQFEPAMDIPRLHAWRRTSS
jgi:hypothetical protein